MGVPCPQSERCIVPSKRRLRWAALPLGVAAAVALAGCTATELNGYLPGFVEGEPAATNQTERVSSLWVNSWIDHILDGGGDVANGAELFRVNCAMCHNVAAAGGALTEGKYAPAITETSALHMYAAMVTGPQNMPVFGDMNLSDEDKRDIISALLYQQQSVQIDLIES